MPRRSPGAGSAIPIGLRPPPDVRGDRAAAWLAERQHGVAALWQLRLGGLGPGACKHRVATGRWSRVQRGVVAIGHAGLPPEGRAMAALLTTGDGAVLTARTASALWGIVPADLAGEPQLELLVVGRNPGRRPGVRYRRCDGLDERDWRRRGALVLTSPARTILEEARSGDAATVERLLAQAFRRGLSSEREVRRLLDRLPGRRGTALVRDLVARGPAFDRSRAERMLLELVRRAGLPEPVTNARVAGWEVDAFWPAAGVAAEFDGYAFHHDRLAFAKDRRKWSSLQAAGHPVVSVVWEDLAARPELVAVTLARALWTAAPALVTRT